MSILSTNQKLIRVGTEYSAGRDIDITSGVISYTGNNGREYSAGENIGINDFTISSRNWAPDISYAAESAYQRAKDYTDTVSSYLSSTVPQLEGQIQFVSGGVDYISGVAITAHQSLEGYLTKASGDEYYQPIGDYATVSQLENTSGEIVNLIPTDFVTNEQLQTNSAAITAMIPSTAGLASEQYVDEHVSGKADKSEIPDVSEFITNVSAEATYQPIGNYLSSNALEGYATQDWVENKGYITGVDLSNYYQKSETSGAEELAEAFNNIGPGGDEEVNELVHSNSGEWNKVSAKLDTTAYTPFDPTYMSGAIDDKLNTTAFSTVSGDFLTAIPDSYATKDFVSNSISSKLDSSSFSTVSSTFLTNDDLNGYATEDWVGEQGYLTAVDLTPYQTTAGMTAYQPVGDYATTNDLEQVSGDITALIPSTAGLASESYVQTNSAVLTGMIDAKQDALTFGYDEQNRINSINNSALAGGGEVPEGTMVESNLEYNSQGYINGYNGSAVATIDQERQWFTHDSTLTHLSNSAQYALGVSVPNVAQQMGVDRTLLWSGTPNATGYNMTLSDNLNNYDRFEVVWKTYARYYVDTLVANSTAQVIALGHIFANNDGNYEKSITTWATTDGLTYNWKATIHGSFTGNQSNSWNSDVVPLKIYGIGKKV